MVPSHMRQNDVRTISGIW